MVVSPLNVYILISVYNTSKNPGMVLFVDPWALHLDDKLSLISTGTYNATFKDTASAIHLQAVSSTQRSINRQINGGPRLTHGVVEHKSSTKSRVKIDDVYSYRN